MSITKFFSKLLKKITSKEHIPVEERVVGWEMTPEETCKFFNGLDKQIITFYGYSSGYEDEESMLKIVKDILSQYSPESYVVNIGATDGGIGQAYPIAKAMGFTTIGIVSSIASQHLDYISQAVDHICFVKDDQWGGKLPDSDQLSPTSQAMVTCSDILIGIGGGEISLQELTAGREQGKTIRYFPAEINHAYLEKAAKKKNLPPPTSFWGPTYETFADQQESS